MVAGNATLEALCGDLARPLPSVNCTPEPDAFSPCEDLLGDWVMRLVAWAVGSIALLGNAAVLIVLLGLGRRLCRLGRHRQGRQRGSLHGRGRLSVPQALMCHLALADLAMGVYLLLLAVMDSVSMGSYFNYAIDWQNGEPRWPCNLCYGLVRSRVVREFGEEGRGGGLVRGGERKESVESHNVRPDGTQFCFSSRDVSGKPQTRPTHSE